MAFKNWAENVDLKSAVRVRPGSRTELIDAIRAARRDGVRIRPIGSGWSFTDCAPNEQRFLDLHDLNRVFGLALGEQGFAPADPRGRAITAGERALLPGCLRSEVASAGRRLVYLEAGITIHEILVTLGGPILPPVDDGPPRLGPEPAWGRWMVPTMGGASGQTIAGAVGTGTHGGDIHIPPIADMIRAIHVVGYVNQLCTVMNCAAM